MADILASAELIRRQIAEFASGDPFSVGYFVGETSTPTKIEKEERDKLLSDTQDRLDDEYKVVDICPFCHQKSILLSFLLS